MKMKTVIAALLAVLMLACCLGGCAQPDENAAQIEQLQEENAQLKAEIAQLQEQIAVLEAGPVSDWSLTGTPLVQGSGAEVTLTAVPTLYREGQMASLRVMLEGQITAELFCDWDGSAYCASLELDAADGYSYYLLLTEPDGKQEILELNSPANPVDPMLVYMYSSLSASCMLNVYDWQITDGTLEILVGDAQIQLPKMTATGEPAACTGAALVLQLDGQEVERKSLLTHMEGEILEVDVGGMVFSVPEMDETGQLDLWLEVVLSDGQVLTHSGSSWFWFDGELTQAVG